MNKKQRRIFYWVGALAVVSTSVLVGIGPEAEFFDWFGLLIFSFLLGVGIWMFEKKKYPFWLKFSLSLIGVLGLIVDGFIILRTFI